MSPWGEPPRWFVRLSGIVLVAGIVVTVAGAVRIGVTVDETFHVMRLQNYLTHGSYVLDDDLGPGGVGSWVTDAYVYAPVTGLFLHTLNVVVGNEAWGQVAATGDAYVVRHLGVALVSLGAVGACAAMARVLSGSWRWGVVAAAVLVALPMWSGHAMFNVKDTPVATGHTLVTLGCMLLLVVPRAARSHRLGIAALVVVGEVLAIGTRPAIWPGLAAALGTVVIVVLLRRGRTGQGQGSEWWRVLDASLASLVALALLVAVYPEVFLHPLEWLLGATSESAGYQGGTFWGYIPLNIMTTVPIVLLLFGLVGSLGRLRQRMSHGGDRGRTGARTRTWTREALVALVLLQALLLPAILVVRMPSLNGGLRHLLFAAPAVAVLIAAGIAQVLSDASGRRSRGVVAAVAAVGLVVPTVAQVQLFPLGYSYANPLTDAIGLDLTADFWQASLRDYADVLPDDTFVVCGAELDDEARPLRRMTNGGQSWLEVGRDCRTSGVLSVVAPYLDDPDDAAVDEQADVAPEFVALVVYDDPAPRGCEEIGRVTRHRLLTEAVASRALLCPLVLPDYPDDRGTPVVLDATGRGGGYLLGGWSGTGGDPFIEVDARASLGFHLDDLDDLRIRLDGVADGSVEFLLNNEPVASEEVAGGWELSPDAPPAELGEAGNVVVTVVASGGPARVTGVEVLGGGA